MKISNLVKLALVWLVLGLELSIVQPVKGQSIPESPFQYAIFYNGLLEFTDCAPLTINGRVQCNSNIYVGCPSSSSTLAFNYFVTASGTITNPSWFGYSQGSYIAGNITYGGTPAPGWGTGEPVLTLPMGGATNSPAAIIQLPTEVGSATNPLSIQRYYYKADLVILVTNTTSSNVATTVMLKNTMFDPSPLIYSFTNNVPTNTAGYTNMLTNWNKFGASYWLSTNTTFFDARQNQTNRVTQIDIGKFATWISTNTNCLAKWVPASPFNGIIYIADLRTTNGVNGNYMDCVRLTNGQFMPTVGASNVYVSGSYTTADSYPIPGLSIATINPLYVEGNYNSPTADLASTNVAGTAACSVICDAITILSSSWSDSASFSGGIPGAAASDTVNAAMIAGNVPSTGSSDTQFSGGVHNLTRLLENWGSSTLWLNTSIVNLYPSAQATAQYQKPAIYYDAPTRHFSFDQNFTNFASLPPGSPLFTPMLGAVTLSNLNQSYNGSPCSVTATTVPAGLNVIVTYSNPSNTVAPTAAGSYAVTATINDPVFVGVATNILVISKGAATVSLTNLSQAYDGAVETVSATTVPSGLAVKLTYNGFNVAPTNVGHYTVVGTVNDVNYQGSATNTFIINQAAASVSLTNLSQTYDGAAETVSATTVPPSLSVAITYNGSANAPTNIGSYTVVGTVMDLNYQGSVTNTFVIAPPVPGPITVSGTTTLEDGTFQLSFTNVPGTSFSVLGSADPTVPLTNWIYLGGAMEVSPGEFQFIDLQATNELLQFYIIRSP